MSKVIKGLAVAALISAAIPLAVLFAPALMTAGFVTAVNALALGAFLSGISAQLTNGRTGGAPSVSVEYTGTVEPRRIIYGTQKVSGMNVLPPVTSGTNNKFLHQVLAIAGHEVNAITDVYFGQDAITSGTIGSITGATSDGVVGSGTYANKAWIRRYTGTSTQTADFILDNALTIWTSSHRGRGIAYMALQYEYDETVYKTGKPEVTCLVQGMKVYDPRLDSTNGGSGAQRLATPSTWTLSSNPPLCLANYLIDATVGMGEDSTRVDWAMVATAADYCDELVACPTASTQKRYTCNTVLYSVTAYEENIGVLVGAMLGSCLYSGGKWRIRAGVWETASFAITDSNVIGGGLELATAYPYKERYNGIRGSFLDPDQNYQPTEFPATQNATYVSADGESVFKDVRFEACTNVYEAQRAAVLLTRKSRNKQIATISCDMSAWKIRPGETGIVTITELGWSNKTVRCEGWKFNPAGYVDIVVREELSSDWNDPIEADYITPLAISNPTPVYYTPAAPSALAATNTIRGPNLSWTAPAVVPVGAAYEVWEYTASTPFASASKVWEGVTTSVVIPKSNTTQYYYWVRVRMADGTLGTEYPTSAAGVAGAGTTVVTTDVATDAVTFLTETTAAGPTEGGIVGSAAYVNVLSIAVSAQSVATELVVTIIGEYEKNHTASSFGLYGSLCIDSSGSDFISRVIHWDGTAATKTYYGTFSIERRYSLAISTAQTYYFLTSCNRSASGEHAYLKNMLLKVEVIKR